MLLAALAPGAGSARPSDEADAADRPLIERSYLIAPERIGEFTLDDVHYDEANRYSGARFRYTLPGHQETRFDVFVYPAGRMPQAKAIEPGMIEFKAGIQQAEQAGYYRDVRILGEESFPLEAGQQAGLTANSDAKEARLIALINMAKPVGQRLRLQYLQLPGEYPMHSNGYLFHRQLFYFKVRVSAARDRIDDAGFLTLADRGARELVSAIEVLNLGGCANAVIEVDPKADPEAFAEVFVRRSAEIQGENCIGKPDAEQLARKSAAARVVTIEFSPNDWKAR